ncbi:hypothetical protein [Clostridium uliginosum]|uniref:Uncharacterized protein n=1 Tax=Clostridium uliginosum TaxID=119641 RepID=A0A1I1QT80_9CLOT|nr:hypothetical protein [Clostridium uliginosum]SFD25326.1 hypothetical protein SAMN05421842_12734 [Clostridium uliginosum]
MKRNKEFMEIYSAKKEKKEMRSLIRSVVLICNIMNFLSVDIYNLAIYNKSMSWSGVINFFIIMSVYNLISLILYIFPERLEFLIDLYTAVAFIVSSILYFCLSMIIFVQELDILETFIVIVISIMVYICLIIAIARNIKNKMRNGFRKIKLNKGLISSFTSLCAALGIVIAKTTQSDVLIPAIALLLLSYIFTPTIIGFHKFYLKIKKSRN